MSSGALPDDGPVAPRGLPEIEALTSDQFAQLPKKKISALWTKADGRTGDALRARLAPLTNCASYLVCVGSMHFALRRTRTVIEPKLLRCLPEAVFAYQLDWRYPKPFGITMTGLDTAPPEVALRRAFCHAFFELLEQSPSFFMSGSAQPVASYMVTLTRHLLGRQVKSYDEWLEALLLRLERLAVNPAPDTPSKLRLHASREAWELATRVRHGRPLPINLLDVTAEPPAENSWPALVAATVARLSPETNPLLQPHAVLIERGLATPYAI